MTYIAIQEALDGKAHRLGATAEQDQALATTPADELLALPFLQPRIPAREARELPPRHGGGGTVGETRRAGQHDQPWYHHHAAFFGELAPPQAK